MIGEELAFEQQSRFGIVDRDHGGTVSETRGALGSDHLAARLFFALDVKDHAGAERSVLNKGSITMNAPVIRFCV